MTKESLDVANAVMNNLRELIQSQAAEIELLNGTLDSRDRNIETLRAENRRLLKEMQYIAGISNGQVNRIARAALAPKGGV